MPSVSNEEIEKRLQDLIKPVVYGSTLAIFDEEKLGRQGKIL